MVVAKDRISELPDSILEDEILSRLPTKLAVSTSILSKRWRWLWTGVPALEFSYTGSNSSMFMNYVDNVLLHHHVSNLHSFKLTCDHQGCDGSRVLSWISNVVSKKQLRELYLHIHQVDFNVIPHCVFGCKSLVVLKISSNTNRCVFAPPTWVSLPSLATLELDRLIFADEDSTQHFFSSLFALKQLVLRRCKFSNHQKLVISVPSLSHLKISNARFQRYKSSYAQMIKICGPNLDYLCCWTTDLLPTEYILFDMPMLQEVMINTDMCCIPPWVLPEEEHLKAHNLLKNLVKTKKLHIPARLLMALSHEDLMNQLPTFTNLTFLRVIGTGDGKYLLSLLRIMTNLESLIFDKVYASGEDELTSYIGDMLPQCFESRIKTIQLNEYDGCRNDWCMIEFLLTNVVALEIIDIMDAQDINLIPVKSVRLGRHSLNPNNPLSRQDL